MIARLDILLPFNISVPENEKYCLHEYEDDGYNITIYPPITITDLYQPYPYKIMLDEIPSVQTNGLRINYKRDNFNRRIGTECDPPVSMLCKTVNSFLSKLKFVTHSTKVCPIDFTHASWRIKYFNDDGSELTTDKELYRECFARSMSFSCTSLNNEIWENIYKLPLDYVTPAWINLLLDAEESISQVGLSIVLITTALEVFISYVLNGLSVNNIVPTQLWKWINEREWHQEPSLKDKYDILLKTLLGISLKENTDLWKAFINIKSARNSFVHEGIAKIGKTPLTTDDVRRLLIKAKEIITFIKEKLPENLKWLEYKHSIKISYSQPLFKSDTE